MHLNIDLCTVFKESLCCGSGVKYTEVDDMEGKIYAGNDCKIREACINIEDIHNT